MGQLALVDVTDDYFGGFVGWVGGGGAGFAEDAIEDFGGDLLLEAGICEVEALGFDEGGAGDDLAELDDGGLEDLGLDEGEGFVDERAPMVDGIGLEADGEGGLVFGGVLGAGDEEAALDVGELMPDFLEANGGIGDGRGLILDGGF